MTPTLRQAWGCSPEVRSSNEFERADSAGGGASNGLQHGRGYLDNESLMLPMLPRCQMMPPAVVRHLISLIQSTPWVMLGRLATAYTWVPFLFGDVSKFCGREIQQSTENPRHYSVLRCSNLSLSSLSWHLELTAATLRLLARSTSPQHRAPLSPSSRKPSSSLLDFVISLSPPSLCPEKLCCCGQFWRSSRANEDPLNQLPGCIVLLCGRLSPLIAVAGAFSSLYLTCPIVPLVRTGPTWARRASCSSS
jgi:hypothetical protein